MPKNVMKMLKPSPKRGKNAFDLSHRHVLTAKFGELLPISCLETVPGDYFEINCADLLRAMPLVTSPFMRAKQHIDFWYVPYTDLWHNFNAFITQKDQPMSAAFESAAACPYVHINDILTVLNGSVTSTHKDIVGLDYQNGARKLFNLLGYGDAAQLNTSSVNPSVNIWRIAAYNYIWYNEYRQNYYDDGRHLLTTNESVASIFNFDDIPCASASTNDIKNERTYSGWIEAMFQMRYRCWKKDLFTGIMPSTQFGALSTVDTTLPQNILIKNVDSGSSTTIATSASGYLSAGGASHNRWSLDFPSAAPLANFSSFDVLALRQAQAIQIWRENSLRAGNRVNDNMNAHFGEFPSYQRDHRPTYVGSYDAPLNIADVNSTAQIGSGGNQALGDVAGKGLSSLDSKTLKFQTNDFGVIMAIFSLLPEAEYNATGIERTNQLIDRYDYFTPEMENLGLEAVSTQNFRATPVSAGFVLGYAPRYYGYKTKLDKCFGPMMSTGGLKIWCSPKFDVDQALSTLVAGAFPIQTLYVNPSIYDVNFSVNAATSDQLICDFFFDVSAVRPMTVLGMPSY